MTSETKLVECVIGKWYIDGDNIGHCEKFKSGICLSTGEVCLEKGMRDYNIIQKGVFNEYGELNKNGQVKTANKDKTPDMLPYEVRYAINDLSYRRSGI